MSTDNCNCNKNNKNYNKYNHVEPKLGIFSLCNGKWDETQKKFVNSTQTEVFKCCMNRCQYPIKFCNAYCQQKHGNIKNNLDRCNKTCTKQYTTCEEGCKSSKYWLNNPFISCAKDKGCWSNISKKIDCIKNNKEALIECCRTNCIPTLDNNCDELCNYMYDLASKPDQEIPELESDNIQIVNKPVIKLNNKWIIYIIGIIGIGIIGILFFFYLLKK